MFALNVAHSSGGNANKHRSIPLVITMPPRNKVGVGRGESNALSHPGCAHTLLKGPGLVLPLRPTLTHNTRNSCICTENTQLRGATISPLIAKRAFFTSYPLPLGIKGPSERLEYVPESLQQRLE